MEVRMDGCEKLMCNMMVILRNVDMANDGECGG